MTAVIYELEKLEDIEALPDCSLIVDRRGILWERGWDGPRRGWFTTRDIDASHDDERERLAQLWPDSNRYPVLPVTVVRHGRSGELHPVRGHRIDPWESDPEFPADEWKREAADDNTRLGYLDWVHNQRKANPPAADVDDPAAGAR